MVSDARVLFGAFSEMILGRKKHRAMSAAGDRRRKVPTFTAFFTCWVPGVLAFLVPLLSPLLLQAHADILERIAAVSKQIQQQPRNARLYLKRGELHRLHREWDAALADFERAAELDPDLMTVGFARGRMFYEAGRLQAAKDDLDEFLAARPAHREGLLTRARVLAQLGKGAEAAQDYTQAIATLARPTPEYYLERAKALASEGDPYLDAALKGLDEGIRTLGPLVTLQLYAMDLELQRWQYDQALARLETIARWIPAERRLFRRGEILMLAGRSAEARQAFTEALAHIDSLHSRNQSTASALELKARLSALLEQIRTGE